MKIIPLTQGRVAKISDRDFVRVRQFKWYAAYDADIDGYYAQRTAYTGGKKRTIKMHIFITGSPAGTLVDHKNFDTLDNQRSNLRVLTAGQSCRHRRKFRNTTSQYIGVSWYKQTKRWAAHIRLNGKTKTIGYFHVEVAAAQAYDRLALKHFGRYAVLNRHKLGNGR